MKQKTTLSLDKKVLPLAKDIIEKREDIVNRSHLINMLIREEAKRLKIQK